MKQRFFTCFGVFLFAINALAFSAKGPVSTHKILSPDGNVEFNCFVDKGQFMYSINFKGKPVIEASSLGLILDDVNIGKGVTLGKHEAFEKNGTYPSRGKHSVATDHYKGTKISFTQGANKVQYTLDVRVYNDGVAFRY